MPILSILRDRSVRECGVDPQSYQALGVSRSKTGKVKSLTEKIEEGSAMGTVRLQAASCQSSKNHLTLAGAEACSGLSRGVIRRAVRSGKLPGFTRSGRQLPRYRIPLIDLIAFEVRTLLERAARRKGARPGPTREPDSSGLGNGRECSRGMGNHPRRERD